MGSLMSLFIMDTNVNLRFTYMALFNLAFLGVPSLDIAALENRAPAHKLVSIYLSICSIYLENFIYDYIFF